MTDTQLESDKVTRRRAVRAAGPSKGGAAETTTVRVEKQAEETTRARKSGPPPRRQPHRRLVAIVAVSVVTIAALAMGGIVALAWWQKDDADEALAHNERYVDTAKQTLVNMYTFKPDTVEQSVDRFYSGISGQLRDEWARGNHIANLKSFLRATGNTSEAVVNGAALENVDKDTKTATVLVALRVTQSDTNGNNKPSLPMRWRVTVQENLDTGQMTASDMVYPDGGS